MLLIGGIFLIAMGALMLIAPGAFFQLTEGWKSSGSAEPSRLYVLSVRIGGAVFLLTGVAASIAQFVL
ncbi:MAG: DUF6199 family natural product biosynthesis protein [Oscillospiraceae bacterium]